MILILLSREYRSTLLYCLLMIRLEEDVKQTWLSLSPGQGEISLCKERQVFTTTFFKKMLEDRKWCDHGMWSSEIHLYFDRKDFIFDVNVSCQIIKRLLCRKSKDIQMHIKK